MCAHFYMDINNCVHSHLRIYLIYSPLLCNKFVKMKTLFILFMALCPRVEQDYHLVNT